ncbi:TolC family protein [Proteus vulgaris]|uniref:TolC family protein n=1 Tax=Proteus vulgaris TaxID=585 RepID=UPI0018E47B0D|nr:TolC family protein [Proteus vulgaris]MBI6529252.1 TolC family protein [Proteus vulgaris]
MKKIKHTVLLIGSVLSLGGSGIQQANATSQTEPVNSFTLDIVDIHKDVEPPKRFLSQQKDKEEILSSVENKQLKPADISLLHPHVDNQNVILEKESEDAKSIQENKRVTSNNVNIAQGVTKSISIADAQPNVLQPIQKIGTDIEKQSLSSVVGLALNWHPSLRNSEYLARAAQDMVDGSRADYFPQVSVGMDNKLYENKDRYGNNNKGSDVRFTVRQMVYDFGKTSTRVDSAEISFAREKIVSLKSQQDLIYQVSQAYFYTSLYNNLVNIAQLQVEGFSEIEQLAMSRSSLGASTQADYVQSKNKLVSAQALLYSYKTQQARWNALLQNYTNNAVSYSQIPLITDAHLSNICYQYTDHGVESIDMLLAKYDHELAKKNMEYARLDNFPTIYLEGNYRTNINKNDNVDYDPDRREIKLNVDIPLFEGGSKYSKMSQAANELLASQYQYETISINTKQQLNVALSQVTGNLSMMNSQKEKIQTAEKTRDLYLLQYKSLGTRPLIDVLNAEGDIHQSNIEYINNVIETNLQSLDCLLASGEINRVLDIPN